jgi:hypothetical protein
VIRESAQTGVLVVHVRGRVRLYGEFIPGGYAVSSYPIQGTQAAILGVSESAVHSGGPWRKPGG